MNRNSKKVIRLTESDLNRIVKESVERVLNEGVIDNIKGAYRFGRDIQGRGKVGAAIHSLSGKQVDNAAMREQGIMRDLMAMIKSPNQSSAEAMRKAKEYMNQGVITKDDYMRLQSMLSSRQQ